MKEILTAIVAIMGAAFLWKKRRISSIGLLLIVLLSFAGIGYCAIFGFSGQQMPVSAVVRGEKGSESKRMEFQVRTDSEEHSQVTLDIPAVQMGKEETEAILAEFCHRLDEEILGENASLQEVCYPLCLLSAYPDSPVQVQWQTDEPEYLNWEGKLGPEIPEEGADVLLQGELLLQNTRETYQRRIRVFPSKDAADLPGRILAETERVNADKDDGRYYLPDRIDKRQLQWYRTADSTGWMMVCMALLLCGVLVLVHIQKGREEQQKRADQLDLEYPELVSQMQMLLGAGLGMRMVLERIADEYRKSRNLEEKGFFGRRKKTGKKLCCEEIIISCKELENGLSEAEVYRRLGARCGTANYRGLALLLEQNMSKGGQGLMQLLEQEALAACEGRLKRARQEGEKVSVRLLLPMGMMLMIVLALIMIPAFLSL